MKYVLKKGCLKQPAYSKNNIAAKVNDDISQCSREEIINELMQLRKRSMELEEHLRGKHNTDLNFHVNDFTYPIDEQVYGNISGSKSKGSDAEETYEKTQVEKEYVKRKELEVILDAIPSAIFIVDAADGRISYINKRGMDLYGVNYVGFDLKEHLSEIKVLKLDGTPYLPEDIPLNRSLKMGKVIRNKEMIMENSNGIRTPVSVSSAPLFNSCGIITKAIVIFEDISEHKQMEYKLRESEERFHVLVDSISQTVWETDAEGAVVKDSPSWRGYTGQTFEEAVNYGWTNVIHPDDREYAMSSWLRCIAGNTNVSDEYRIKGPNGEWRWTNVIAAPIHDCEGRIIKWVGMNIDITQRKEAEEALRASEEKLSIILNNSRDGINMFDLTTGRYIYMNPAQVEMTGYGMEEINNASLEEANNLVHPDDLEMVVVQQKLAAAGMGSYFETKYRWKVNNGEYRWFSDRHQLVRNAQGQPVALVGISRDITEQVKKDELIRMQKNELEAIIDNLDLCYARISFPDFKLNYMNHTAYDKLIYANRQLGSLSHIIGENFFEISKFTTEEMNTVKTGIEALKHRKSSHFNYKKAFLAKGKEWFFKIMFQPLFDMNHDVKEIVAVAIDMTDEVKAKNNMEKTLKVQDEIFANVSHELKTPLNVIFSTNQLLEFYLKNNSFEANKEKFIKSIDIIKQNCYRFTKLINNIVDISKIDSGFFRLHMVNENIVEVIENIVQSVSTYVEGKGINIIFDTDTEEKIIACDPEKIERI
ncbi:MAG: PAS domain-containing sensor histidine kinase, partial [Clostridiaceae bacterium]